MISQELLTELKDILKTDFGLSLTLEEVVEIGNKYVEYHDLLVKIKCENEEIKIPLQTVKSSVDCRSEAQINI